MKHIINLLIILSLSSCNKNTTSSNAIQSNTSPEIKNVTWLTYYSSPSIPNIKWSFSLTVPDTNSYKKLTLNRVTPSYIAVQIDNPISKSYSLTQPGYKCPTYNDNAYFYFEWTKANGEKVKEAQFQVWEQ